MTLHAVLDGAAATAGGATMNRLCEDTAVSHSSSSQARRVDSGSQRLRICRSLTGSAAHDVRNPPGKFPAITPLWYAQHAAAVCMTTHACKHIPLRCTHNMHSPPPTTTTTIKKLRHRTHSSSLKHNTASTSVLSLHPDQSADLLNPPALCLLGIGACVVRRFG